VTLTISSIIPVIKAKSIGKTNIGIIETVSIDSRSLQNSEATLFFALKGPNHDGHKFIPELINALTDTTYIGLTNANDVTIWCRVKAGQLKQNSLNYQIDDDIFRVCGRASWILKRLTKNEYGIIRCDTKMDDIKAIQKLWWKWLKTLKIK